MTKILFIGDVHATPNELTDCTHLFQRVQEVLTEHPDAVVCLLGDQYHTHSIIHAEVMWFWRAMFKQLANYRINIIALVGNHDRPGTEGSPAHAMVAHMDAPGMRVVDRPVKWHGLVFMPYYSDPKKFVEDAVAMKTADSKLDSADQKVMDELLGNEDGTLICHQTFDGSVFENGFYAKDGVDPNLLPYRKVISGHIHAPQEFSKIWYIGAPRWRTLSDANVERAIWLVEFDNSGNIMSKQAYSTGEVCRQIRYLVDTPESPIDGDLDPRHDWRIDIKGQAAWVKERKTMWQGRARVRPFPTDTTRTVRVRESEGIERAFQKYLANFKPRHGTAPSVLERMVQERLVGA